VYPPKYGGQFPQHLHKTSHTYSPIPNLHIYFEYFLRVNDKPWIMVQCQTEKDLKFMQNFMNKKD
jgi:hypothetical protein